MRGSKSGLAILGRLFAEMFCVAIFVVGGGYVILSVADARFSKKGWLREGELFEALPLFQMIPGIIGGHTAVYVGRRVAGLPGALVALVAMIMPSVLVFLSVSFAYQSIPLDSLLLQSAFLGVRAALAGIMLDVVVRAWKKSVSGVFGCVMFAAAVALLLSHVVSPGWVIVGGLVAGVAAEYACRRIKRHAAVARIGSEMPSKTYGCWAVVLVFLCYGLMAFGGGFVLVPMYIRDFVGASAPYLQLPEHDFANVMALTQMTPGPVAANCATFFGHALGGVVGAFAATGLLVLPGSLVLLVALQSVERFRRSAFVLGVFRGVRPVTAALLVCATWSFFGMSVWQVKSGGFDFSPLALLLAGHAFAQLRFRRLGAVACIFLSALGALLVCAVRMLCRG